jgi:hypothetical protein
MNKVRFAPKTNEAFTYTKEEYDRTAHEIVKITYREMLEIMQLKVELRQRYEKQRVEGY